MPVTMICPNLKCGRTVIASDASRGKAVRCAHCQSVFMVPPKANKPATVPTEAETGKKGKK